MGTKKPRLMVVLPSETGAAIREVAELRKVSQAAVVRELLEEATPTLRDVAKALRFVQQGAPQRALNHMAKIAGNSVTEVIQAGLALHRRPGRPRK